MPSWINTSPAPNDSASAPATVTVGASAVTLLAANPNRRSAVIQNVHATNVLYLGFGADPATTTGIRVGPTAASGPTSEYRVDGWTGTIRGIASAVSTDVRVVEFSKTDSVNAGPTNLPGLPAPL